MRLTRLLKAIVRPLLLSLPALYVGAAIAQTAPKAAYVIAEATVLDPASLKEFGQKNTPMLTKAGGVVLVRGAKPTAISGEAPPLLTVIRFPSRAQAEAYLNSPDYKALASLREKAAKFRSYVAEEGDTDRQ